MNKDFVSIMPPSDPVCAVAERCSFTGRVISAHPQTHGNSSKGSGDDVTQNDVIACTGNGE